MSNVEPFSVRVVTGHDAHGRSVIASDGPPDRVYSDLGEDGLVFFEVWSTREMPIRIDRVDAEPFEERLTLAPPPKGVRIRILDVPPDSEDTDYDAVFDNVGGARPRVASDRHPLSFHRTRSIDFGIVIEGELTLLVDDGEATVGVGDVVVQRGTNHGWVNRTDRPCRIAFVLIDGVFTDGLEQP